MNEAGKRLFVFHGCDRKAGTTMLSHCFARLISELIEDSKILFVAMNGNDDVHYFRGNTASIETIKIKVDNGMFSSEEFEDICLKDKGLYIMGGVTGVFTHRDYSVDFPETFLEKAFEFFDVVVVDCGNELDSGLCVGTLTVKGINIMILNQNESSLVRMENSENVYRALNLKFKNYIINRYDYNDPHDISYIRSRFGASPDDIFFTVKEEASFSRLAEIDRQLILDYKCPGFNEDMKEVVREMLKIAGFSERAKSTQKKKFFNFA